MLRLEKKNSGMGISIGIRDRDTWFSHSLITGLTIALLLHGSAIFLFNIQPFRVHYSRTPQLPALVDADISSPDAAHDQHIYAQLEEEKKRRRYPLMPKPSSPDLPQMTLPAHSPAPIITYGAHQVLHHFEGIEREVRNSIDFTEEVLVPPTSIKLSGGLAGRILDWTAPPASLTSHSSAWMHYVADIQIDEESGAIFWYAPLSIEGEAELTAHAEKMIRELQLIPLHNKSISRGTIEITLVAK